MTLNHRLTLNILEYQPDHYGGVAPVVSDSHSFWGALSFVSAKDITSKPLKGALGKRAALQKITVRQGFEVPDHCYIQHEQKLYKPISSLFPDEKAPGYSFFYVRETQGGIHNE